jgi:SAM-dependent methyltransferase
MRVLDVGCGPGRHAHALGAAGVEVVGIDISSAFVEVARRTITAGVSFEVADARALPFDRDFDAAISLCQGAFGLCSGPAAAPGSIDPDEAVLAGMRRALKPGGRVVVSAFAAYFQLRYLEDRDTFDAATGVNHERTVVRNEAGDELETDLWTTCFTPRELRLLCDRVGLDVVALWSVTPGDYQRRPPTIDQPELLLVAERPA